MEPQPQPPTGRTDSSQDALVAFLGTAVVLLLALLVAHQIRPEWFGLAGESSEPTVAFSSRDDGVDPPSVEGRAATPPTLGQRLFADSAMSVVHVTTRSARVQSGAYGEFVSGTGSGLVWDRRGHIVTCAHVLENASGAKVTFGNGQQYEARLVGTNPELDLAVVHVDLPPEDLVPIRLGSSEGLTVGMQAFSIACPYGLGPSLTQGIISGLGRTLRATTGVELESTIQVDVPMHLGSSGGALLDDQGRVIGMNAAIYLGSKRQAGVGFALPIDRVAEAVPVLLEQGYRWVPRYGFVTLGDEDSIALLKRVSGTDGAPSIGVVVSEVDREGPAAKAGLLQLLQHREPGGQQGYIVKDIIIGAMGQSIESRAQLDGILDALEPGQTLELRVARPSGAVDLAIEPTLGSSLSIKDD